MNRFGKLSFAEAIGVIETRLIEGAATLLLMRLERHDLPDGYSTAWPAMVNDWLAYGSEAMKQRQEDAVNRSPIPSPDKIDMAIMAMRWLWGVRAKDRPIVMGKAMGFSWRKLAGKDGRSVRTLQTAHETALEAILARLIEEGG